MQVTEKSSDGLKRAYAVVLPASDIAAKREARLAEIGKELRLPGFRPGKVPPKIVAQRYGQAIMSEGRRELMGRYVEKMMAPERSVTVALHPTPALAQDASMSLLDYEDFVYRACLLEEPDPIASWREVAARQERIREWLQTRSTITVQSPNADLRLSADRRRYVLNFPFDRLTLADFKSVIPEADRAYDATNREWSVERRHWGALNALFANFAAWDLEIGRRRAAEGW